MLYHTKMSVFQVTQSLICPLKLLHVIFISSNLQKYYSKQSEDLNCMLNANNLYIGTSFSVMISKAVCVVCDVLLQVVVSVRRRGED